MGLTRAAILERKKRTKVRGLVIACGRLAHKDPAEDFIDLMTAHIVAVLPRHLMHRLVKGDMGQPMREAMKMTVPFFAR